VTMVWDPPTGEPAYCAIFLDEPFLTSHATGIEDYQYAMCFHDSEPHTVKVQCFEADGTPSPMSDESDPIQMVIMPPLFVEERPLKVRPDSNNDGVVGLADYGIFSDAFGCTNDGRSVTSCPP